MPLKLKGGKDNLLDFAIHVVSAGLIMLLKIKSGCGVCSVKSAPAPYLKLMTLSYIVRFMMSLYQWFDSRAYNYSGGNTPPFNITKESLSWD